MTVLWTKFTPREDNVRPFNALWVFSAPWAHPLWSQYAIFLYDLTTAFEKTPVIHKPGVTHEVVCYALSPDHPFKVPEGDADPEESAIIPLTPPNFGYQFVAVDDAAAQARIQSLVD